MPARKKTQTIQINFRLPPDLHGKLVRAAAKDRRSLNEEMVWRLERSLALSDMARQNLTARQIYADAMKVLDDARKACAEIYKAPTILNVLDKEKAK